MDHWDAPEPREPLPARAASAIEQAEALDAVAKPLSEKVRGLVDHQPLKDVLSGTWLGHALHPLLTDAVIGSWTSATVLDLVGGRQARPAAQRLVGIGILASLPTAVTGSSDWSDTTGKDVRVGLVHAGLNSAALGLYGGSWVQRRRGRTGRVLGLAGAGLMGASAYLGGHLSYSRGIGVDETTFERWPDDWTDTANAGDVPPEGATLRAQAGDVAVLLARVDGAIRAISDRCSHRSGSLADGAVRDGCVECPLHGSVFRLDDGSVVQGPATAPQPAFDVQVVDGRVQVRAAQRQTA